MNREERGRRWGPSEGLLGPDIMWDTTHPLEPSPDRYISLLTSLGLSNNQCVVGIPDEAYSRIPNPTDHLTAHATVNSAADNAEVRYLPDISPWMLTSERLIDMR